MRRKYDIRNKKSFIIILILAIAVICVFSLFIYKYSKASKIQYVIETGCIVQDINKNYINIDEDAILKIRWNDSYYLMYQENKVNLGKKVIVYNTITNGMKLYGTFYEIQEDGKIVDNNNETILSNTTDTKFYKLDDREYLLVDRTINSNDKSIDASNYLLVELDRQGNAKLSNYKLNLKTISPTVLVTSKYTFDIANEILNFGSYDIDLKKIIGTTNQYKPEENDGNDGTGTGGGTGTGTGTGTGNGSGTGTGSGGGGGGGGGASGSGTGNGDGTGDGTGNGTGSGGTGGNGGSSGGTGIGSSGTGDDETGTGGAGDIINNGDNGNITDIGEIKDKSKMTSILRVKEGLTQIDIDYVIYDPYNEYKAIYAEIIKSGEIEVVNLSKNDTHLVINGLAPNTEYNVNFIYTTLDDETEEIVPNTFEQMTLKTKMPQYSISVYKISKVYNTLTYKAVLQNGFNVSKINVNLSFEFNDIDPETGDSIKRTASIDSSVNVNVGDTSVMGTFDISGYDIDNKTLLRLEVVSVESAYGILNINSSYTFRFGGKNE